MAEVMCLRHQGIRCVLPAPQVRAVDRGRAVGPVGVALWEPPQPTDPSSDDRLLEVMTASGARWLRCSQVRPVRLARDSVWQLPPVLRDALPLEHIVGLAELDDELLWLVDLRRFAPDELPSRLNQHAE